MENVGALGTKKNVTLSRNIEKLRIGQFQLGMCADFVSPKGDSVLPKADDENKANELNEANNCSPASLKIAVVPAQCDPATDPRLTPACRQAGLRHKGLRGGSPQIVHMTKRQKGGQGA
ncbi:MAG: hypothetical protein HYY10_00255 [Candidatus Liptonbacteria bacterium]|nr:hypothetical protein [Candidatus Liptonbacteria bacterium]